MLSDEWLPRYRLLENFTAKWNGNGNGNGNGNAYDRGDYNSSFALRAVELKMILCNNSHITLLFLHKNVLYVGTYYYTSNEYQQNSFYKE